MEIRDIIMQRGLKIIAEVGMYEAKHAANVLEVAASTLEKYYWIDPWAEYAELGQSESMDMKMKALTRKRWDSMARMVYSFATAYPEMVRVIRLPSVDAAGLFADAVFDLVYIDADHSYLPLLEDIISWLPKIKDGGIISGHDFTPRWPDVCRVVEEVFGEEARHISAGGQWFVDLSRANKYDYYRIAKQLKDGAVSE